MPVELSAPVEPIILHHAKVVAIKVEDNVEQWVKLWVSYGSMVDGVWAEYVDPNTGLTAGATEYHIENGHNPLMHGQGLRKCPSCGLWWTLETECSCGEETEPYDGFTRLASAAPSGGSLYEVIKLAVYAFLTAEEVPDPITGEVRPLLATV